MKTTFHVLSAGGHLGGDPQEQFPDEGLSDNQSITSRSFAEGEEVLFPTGYGPEYQKTKQVKVSADDELTARTYASEDEQEILFPTGYGPEYQKDK